MNHVTDECYSKHGFPRWMKQKCRSNASVNQIENQSSLSNLKEDRPINEEKQVVPVQSLTSHQVQQLLKILQNPDKIGQINTLGETKSEHSEGKFSWILDTGVIDHVTCMRNIFTNFHKIKPIKVGLPNGSCVYANYAGTRITKKLIIYDVFYIPKFTLNIISVQNNMVSERVDPALFLSLPWIEFFQFTFSLISVLLCFLCSFTVHCVLDGSATKSSESLLFVPWRKCRDGSCDTSLDGSNYHTWSRGINRALLSKNKIKFVNGEIQEPPKNGALYDVWERCNMMVISWITRTLNPQIMHSTIYIDNAIEL